MTDLAAPPPGPASRGQTRAPPHRSRRTPLAARRGSGLFREMVIDRCQSMSMSAFHVHQSNNHKQTGGGGASKQIGTTHKGHAVDEAGDGVGVEHGQHRVGAVAHVPHVHLARLRPRRHQRRHGAPRRAPHLIGMGCRCRCCSEAMVVGGGGGSISIQE